MTTGAFSPSRPDRVESHCPAPPRGHERDLLNTSGVADDRDYMMQRSYIPLIGRFTTVDPMNGYPQNPQSWNRYTYVLGNPLKYIDPLGLLIRCDADSCSDEIDVIGEDPTEPGSAPPPAGISPITIMSNPFGPSNGPNNFRVPGTGTNDGGTSEALEVIKIVAENTRPNSDVCGGVTWGYNFEGSLINTFLSSGGGATKGYNVQFLPGGIGIYSYETVGQSSLGWSPGINVTMNWAYGTGPWSGESWSAQGGWKMLSAGLFGPASGSILDGNGYAGFELGAGGSPTLLTGGVTKLNYEPVTFFGRDLGCYGGSK